MARYSVNCNSHGVWIFFVAIFAQASRKIAYMRGMRLMQGSNLNENIVEVEK